VIGPGNGADSRRHQAGAAGQQRQRVGQLPVDEQLVVKVRPRRPAVEPTSPITWPRSTCSP